MSQEQHNDRIQEKRARMEAILEAKKKKLLESEEKKKFSLLEKDSSEKDKRIALLEGKVSEMEKQINQLRLDFSRYRARNPSKGVKGK